MARQLPPVWIPLAEKRIWRRWKRVTKDGKIGKVPCNARGVPEAATKNACTLAEIGDAWGDIGLILGPETGLAGVDIDHCCANGKGAAWLFPLIQAAIAAGCYVQRSVSGTGVHIVGGTKGGLKTHTFAHPFDPAFPDAKIECFAKDRFFVFTGDEPAPTGKPLGVIDDVFRRALALEKKAPSLVDARLKRVSDDTSADFHAAMNALRRAGWTVEEAAAYAMRWPDGAAAQYIGEGKIVENVRRSFERGADTDLGGLDPDNPVLQEAGKIEIPGYHWTPNGVTDDEGKRIFHTGVRIDRLFEHGPATFLRFLVYDAASGEEKSHLLQWDEASAFMRQHTTQRISPSSSQALKRYIETADTYLRSLKKVTRVYEQFGWTNDKTSFVHGEHIYKNGVVECAEVSDELKDKAAGLLPYGDVENWRKAAQALCKPGFEVHLAGMLASAGAPLFALLWPREGGVIISYCGRRSGTGKSTALAAACSIWGQPRCIDISAATNNHRFQTLSIFKNLPVLMDEANLDAKILTEFVQTFTNGLEKGRLQKDGKAHKQQGGWSTIMLMAGNGSKIGALAGTEQGTAQAARILEFRLERPIAANVEDMFVKENFDNNGGHLGRTIALYLSKPENRDTATARMQELYEQYQRGKETDRRFHSRALALIRTMGEIMRIEGWLDIDNDRVEQVLAQAVATSAENRADLLGPEEEFEADVLFENYVRDGLRAMTVFMPGNGKTSLRRDNRLVGYVDKETDQVVIDYHDFDRYLRQRGAHPRSAREQLKESGRLLQSKVRKDIGKAEGINISATADVLRLTREGAMPDRKVIPMIPHRR